MNFVRQKVSEIYDGDSFWVILGTIITFVFVLTTLAPGIVWDNYGEDGGELTVACAFLGVPHPSGYPFYILLGYLFCLLPFGNLAYRTNLLSAVSGALAAGAAICIVRMLNRKLRLDLPNWLQCSIGVVICLGRTLWSQMVITEVYSLHVALNLMMIACFFSWNERRTKPRIALKLFFFACILWSLALGVHLTSAFLGLGILFFTLATDKSIIRRRTFWLALFGGIGILIFLYSLLPILAHRNPPINWGYIRSISDLTNHVSGQQYRYRMFSFSVFQIIERLGNKIFPWLLQQWGPAGFLMIVAGAMYGFFLVTLCRDRSLRRLARLGFFAWLLFLVPPSFYSLNYNIDDLAVYFALPFTLIGFLFPLGLAGFAALSRYLESPKWSIHVGLILGVLIPLNGVKINYSKICLSQNIKAGQFARNAFRQLPRGSLILSDFDGRTNALLFERWVGSPHRRDVIIVLRSMLATRWYRDHLRDLYPGLHMEEPASWAQGLPWDDRCNHVSRNILGSNNSRPLFVVKRNKFVTGNMFLEMAHGLFRLRTEKIEKPQKFSGRFAGLNLDSIANSDYRGDPFRPGIRKDDQIHYPFLGSGEMTSPAGIPFWIAPPTIESGIPPVFSTCYQPFISARLPLIASFSKNLHCAIMGGVSRDASGTLATLKISYQNGSETIFPIGRIKDYRDSDKINLEFLAAPMIATMVPGHLEISAANATSQEKFKPGVAIFSITQELVELKQQE